ncbi:MAG: preprotein translocase subunit SecE [Candidatus Omnitrophica bacterium]|nr:preprotein translocase subunit SecE [Candidatus Omnitrophota bacterium]
MKKTAQFIKEVKEELKKVSWSTRQEILQSTGVVIVATLLLAVYIGVIDLMLSKLLSILFK